MVYSKFYKLGLNEMFKVKRFIHFQISLKSSTLQIECPRFARLEDNILFNFTILGLYFIHFDARSNQI